MAFVGDYCDWRDGLTFEKRNLYILQHAIETDIVFELIEYSDQGPKKKLVGAHKTFLMAASDVFKSMLYGSVTERQPVRIKDIDYQAFISVLRYIYTGKCWLDVSTVGNIWLASEKYLLTDLRSQCVKYLCQNSDAFFCQPSFLYLPRPLLEELLDCERLFTYEVDVFIACLKWARERIKERSDSPYSSNLSSPELSPVRCGHASQIPDSLLGVPPPATKDPICAVHGFLSATSLQNHANRILVCTCHNSRHEDSYPEATRVSFKNSIKALIQSASGHTFRETLGHLLFKIRFPIMTREQFHYVKECNILSNHECTNVEIHRNAMYVGDSIFPTRRRFGATMPRYYGDSGPLRYFEVRRDICFTVKCNEPFDMEGFYISTRELKELYIQTCVAEDGNVLRSDTSWKRLNFKCSSATYDPTSTPHYHCEIIFVETIRKVVKVRFHMYFGQFTLLQGVSCRTKLTLDHSYSFPLVASGGSFSSYRKRNTLQLTSDIPISPVSYVLCDYSKPPEA